MAVLRDATNIDAPVDIVSQKALIKRGTERWAPLALKA